MGNFMSMSRHAPLWPGAHFHGQGDLAQRSWQGGFFREHAQRSCTEILLRGLSQRSCQQSSCKRAWTEISSRLLARDLSRRSCEDTSYVDLVQGHCIEVCGRYLAQRSLHKSCEESPFRELAQRFHKEILRRGIGSAEILPKGPLQRERGRDLAKRALQPACTEISQEILLRDFL